MPDHFWGKQTLTVATDYRKMKSEDDWARQLEFISASRNSIISRICIPHSSSPPSNIRKACVGSTQPQKKIVIRQFMEMLGSSAPQMSDAEHTRAFVDKCL